MNNEQEQEKAMELAQQCSDKFCERWYWNPSSEVRSELAKEICGTLNLPRLLAAEAENAELRQRLIAEHLPEEYKSWEQVWNNIVTTQKERERLRAELEQAATKISELSSKLKQALTAYDQAEKGGGE